MAVAVAAPWQPFQEGRGNPTPSTFAQLGLRLRLRLRLRFRNILESDGGETWFKLDDSAKVGTRFTQKMRIPEDLRCDRCTLRYPMC